MMYQDENPEELAATEILSLIIDIHTIMMLSVPNLTGMQEAKCRLLSILECTGSESMTELCNQMFISKPYMTRLVDSLVTDGSVERHPDEIDRRVIKVSLTDEGRRYLRDMLKELKNNLKPFLSGFSIPDLETICKASKQIHATFSKNSRIIDHGTWSFYTSQKSLKDE
jgi:DNA-binding MarR family transcriptional regulator